MSQIVSLWTFSCNVYSHEEVMEECLYLQERYSVNIPLLLCCCWSGVYDQPITDMQALRMQQLANEWTQKCILPLRQARQSMKNVAPESNNDAWQQVREQVKSTELLAEEKLINALQFVVQDPLLQEEREYDDPVGLLDAVIQLMPGLLRRKKACQALGVILHAVLDVANKQMDYDTLWGQLEGTKN